MKTFSVIAALLAMMLGYAIAGAQIYSPAVTATPPPVGELSPTTTPGVPDTGMGGATTPGVPDTGAGADATGLILFGAVLLLVIAASWYMRRRRLVERIK